MTAETEQPWTLLRLLEWTTNYFRQRGSESPRLDAEVLLAHARQCDRIQLYTAFDQVPDEGVRSTFRELVRRRGEGVPVAYLVGSREFYSLKFRVNEHVLIPRPETEHVVIEALDTAKRMTRSDRPLRIADVGTGSGAIAVAIAKHLPTAELVATDVSQPALDLAAHNAQQHLVADRIEFIATDLLDAVDPSRTFDLICSNPPYVSEAEFAALPPTVRDHEPRGALVAGPRGTEIIERLLALAPVRLEPAGQMILELSPMIAAACLAMATANPRLSDARLFKDLAGHQRVLVVNRVAELA